MNALVNVAPSPGFSSKAPPTDDPGKEIRNGIVVILGAMALFGGWAAVAPLDAAATASGQIEVSGHNQVIQHQEGGVVSALRVVEGQHVRAGQILIELAPESVGAEVAALRSQDISLQAQRVRLSAELQGQSAIQWPGALTTLVGPDKATADEAMASQQSQFNADMGALRTEKAMNAQRAAGLRGEIGGSEGQLEANQRQQVLLDQQLQGMRTLTAKGFAAPNSIRALERTSADLTGAQRQYAASISGLQHQVAETQLQSANLDLQRRQLAATSLHDTDDALNALKPKLDAVRQQLERSTLRAPTDGVVTGLTVFSAGAVAAPGQQLMEIVPTHPALTVRARLAASEIEGVHPGQKAEVHFLLSGVRGIPVLSGALTQLSADSFTDQRSGQSFYTAEVTVPKSQLDLIRRVPGADSALRPGVPVQIMIALHKRTAFEYLFEPLYQSIWGAFRQR